MVQILNKIVQLRMKSCIIPQPYENYSLQEWSFQDIYESTWIQGNHWRRTKSEQSITTIGKQFWKHVKKNTENHVF